MDENTSGISGEIQKMILDKLKHVQSRKNVRQRAVLHSFAYLKDLILYALVLYAFGHLSSDGLFGESRLECHQLGE